MLSIARRCSRRASLQPFSLFSSRGLATEASTPIPAENLPADTADASAGQSWRKGKVPVREDHGLYAFFRRKADEKLTGEKAYETVESGRRDVSGRAWKASELRLKSFKDLHTLWYVTLRERNLLATQREEARRAGIKTALQAQTAMAGHCRKTMARIKAVMNERRLAYEGAVKLVQEHQEVAKDKQVWVLRDKLYHKAIDNIMKFQEKGRKLRRFQALKVAKAKKALEAQGGVLSKGAVAPAGNAGGEAGVKTESSTTPAAEGKKPVVETATADATPASTPSAPAKESRKKTAAPTGSDPESAVDTATAGLFGKH
ncbi:hypothetical protein NMY22_g8520 [Coprinellus aureogranulatus]|nr:hypothetical protein NMY22_g8520 [Coprinellus aureogranulatus]